MAENNLGSDLIVIARRECGCCKMCDGIQGLFEVLYFSFELISVCVAALKGRLSAKKLHYSHGFVINVGVQRTRRA